MNDYFDWYDISNECRIRFAKMKLEGFARMYWTFVIRGRERLGQEPIDSWFDMKTTLTEKYLPTAYKEQFIDQLSTLRQGSSSFIEYMTKLRS